MSNTSQLVLFVINKFYQNVDEMPINYRCPLEQDLANECGVSRTTVRKAFAQLEKEGIIQKVGNNRYLRKKINSNDIVQTEAPISKEKEVSQYLIGLISDGKIIPGQKISENKIATSLNCSMSPVREALISLAPLGIFIKKDRKQWQASAPTNRQFEELIEFRKIIEVHCLKGLMKKESHEKHLPKIRSIFDKTEKLLKKKTIDTKLFSEADVSFHQLILKSNQNQLLFERSEFVYAIIDFQLRSKYFTSERAILGLSQHLKIIEAIIQFDEGKAINALEFHLDSALESLKMINDLRSR